MKLSIITINYNNLDGLRKTIDSVVNQTWQEFEWIIVDGGSTDGSKELIEETAAKLAKEGTPTSPTPWHVEHFSLLGFTAEDWKNGKYPSPASREPHPRTLLWTSEKDNGIYNAMNKGLMISQGEHCLFLNSGDILADQDSMKKVSISELNADIVSFDIYVDCISKKGYRKSVDKFNSYWYCDNYLYHPATWINRACLLRFPYHEEYKIISDWVFFFEALVLNDFSYQHVSIAFSVFFRDGISCSSSHDSKDEMASFLRQYFPSNYLIDKQKEDSMHYIAKGVANMGTIGKKIIWFVFMLIEKMRYYHSNR